MGGRRCGGRKPSCFCFVFLNLFRSCKPSYETKDDDEGAGSAGNYQAFFDREVEGRAINRRADDFIDKFHKSRT